MLRSALDLWLRLGSLAGHTIRTSWPLHNGTTTGLSLSMDLCLLLRLRLLASSHHLLLLGSHLAIERLRARMRTRWTHAIHLGGVHHIHSIAGFEGKLWVVWI